ncbi:molybdenum cofactor biosysynthesis protein [Halobacteriales archaeon SW_10_68_16]|jgi:uncharacterized protein YcbX|nr:MAG: molybdenum cofactor biosysynthesis protein [Halobacteriales archaeon SW_10_68_16]
MAHVERLRVYPVKALEGTDVDEARIREGGTLTGDRAYAIFDGDREVINGKRTGRVNELGAEYDPESGLFTVETPTGERREFDLDAERERATAWFGEFFDEDVYIAHDTETGYVDRQRMGPSVISTATLETVASWFDEMSVESARRRLRANIEVGDVPAFWEDRFVGVDAPAFEAGGVRIEGVTPCGRCIVPARDPDTGHPLEEFQQRFVEKREGTFPEWADREAFDHFYTLMLIARVPEADRGETLRVGDPVEVVE